MSRKISTCTCAFLISVILLPVHGMCQTGKGQNEFYAGIGIQSDYELITRFTAGDNNNYVHAPAYTAGYRYYLTHSFSIGLTLGYQHILDYNLDRDELHISHTRSSIFFIAPEITFCYLSRLTDSRKNELRLYGLFAAGIAKFGGNDPETTPGQILPAFQLTPFGIRYGKILAGYIEAGLGNKGLISAGLSYRLHGKDKNPK